MPGVVPLLGRPYETSPVQRRHDGALICPEVSSIVGTVANYPQTPAALVGPFCPISECVRQRWTSSSEPHTLGSLLVGLFRAARALAC